jgi:copper transport protein
MVTRHVATRVVAPLALAVALLLAGGAASAFGHAVLQGTKPTAGAVLERQPARLVFRFSEPVEGRFGALRVFDRSGKRVESGEPFHPEAVGRELATRLQPDLSEGTYTATYRIISADGHPVSGGLVFSIGQPSYGGASVAELLEQRGTTGPVTDVTFGMARALQYAAIALVIGGVFFLYAIWIPGLAAVAAGGAAWARASEAFLRRMGGLLLGAVAVGLVTGLAGIVLQGATAAGVSAWSALDPEVLEDVLGTRFGEFWGLRLLVWLLTAAGLVATVAGARRPVLRPASLGATGLALPKRRAAAPSLLLLGPPLALLAISPAVAGHASLERPTEVLVPANLIHVLSVSVWAGGLVVLIFALPGATRCLERGDRTRLLAAVVARFSTFAGIAVAALLASGVAQSIVEVRTLDNLTSTAFGRAVLIKLCILLGPLIALGAYNRQKLVPRLRRIAAGGEPPGRAGVLLRRSLRAEVALVAVVLGVTGALVSYAPSTAVSRGPVATTARLGPAEAQLTVDPARVGPNEMHVFLTNARDGSPYRAVKELTVTLELPDKKLGPIKQSARNAGPGHYVMDGAVFGVPGDWEVNLAARVTEFDAHYGTLEVPIR